jgi:histidyl-tRNA synthetase
VGDTTDIVQKEMYTFQDKGGRSITLKPEGTAGVARAYIEHKLYANPQPVKCFILLPVTGMSGRRQEGSGNFISLE